MAIEQFTLEQAEDEIAKIRGQVDKLTEILQTTDVQTTTLEATGALTLANSSAPAGVASSSQLYASSGMLHTVGSSSLDGAVNVTQTDAGTNTVTQATTTLLSGQFVVPGGDADVGTCYRVKCGGFGTWGSTQQALTLIQILSGANINQVLFTNTDFSPSDPFDWDLEMTYHIGTTGSSGSCRALIRAHLNKNNAGVSGSNSFTGVRQAGGVTFNTTVNRTLQLNALWNATTGGPTITCDRSTFERLGP